MMRRGPQGPRTLCNACGLMYANKGVMRPPERKARRQVSMKACPRKTNLRSEPDHGADQACVLNTAGGRP